MSTAKRAKMATGSTAPANEKTSTAAGPSATGEAILAFLRSENRRVTGKEIAEGTGLPIATVLVEAQELTNLGKVELLTDTVEGKTKIFFQLGDETTEKLAGMDPDEKAVYAAVEAAGTAGIWVSKFKYYVPEKTRLKRVLHKLVREGLIKEFKPVNNSKKPHYILASLEPDENVSGGVFYDGDEFDRDFIESLRKAILLILERKYNGAAKEETPTARYQNSYCESQEIAKVLNDSGILKIKLSAEDCEKVLSTLVIDRLVVEKGGMAASRAYRVTKFPSRPSALSAVPCGACPVRHSCTLDGVINPVACVYMSDWLNF
eukprot:m.57026 g.57026  ORF g.57026 m.57026 type:complete len:319 (+) comp13046_c0_seq2:239-1195(+)